jgi:serine protease Do
MTHTLRWPSRHLPLAAIGTSLLALTVLASGIVGGTPGALHADGRTDTAVAPQSARQHALALSEAFREASQRVLPSVVMIQTRQRLERDEASRDPRRMEPGGAMPEGIPDELRDHPLFRRFFEEGLPPSRTQPMPRPRAGVGSGVIIDADGIILTNNHVVAGGGVVLVRLQDGREFEAVEVRTDPDTDLAVVRIADAGPLTAAKIGDSDAMQIGDWVLAVGAPFGLRESVTAGIVSAKSRGIGMMVREEFLQTDAAINPGNSGGPLVNLEGELIGINTAISSTTGGYQGVGFAIPINLAKWVSHQLIAHGTVQRAFLGVGIQPVTMPLSQQLGLDMTSGVVVTEVRRGSPAEKAGLQPGDVVVGFQGQDVVTPRDLQSLVERADPEKSHAIEIMRDGKNLSLDVGVEVLIADRETAPTPSTERPGALAGAWGIEVQPLTADVARQLGLTESEGVVITRVKSGSAAHQAGLREGMLVTRVGNRDITTVSDFQEALEGKSAEESVLVLVRTPEGSRFIVINPR